MENKINKPIRSFQDLECWRAARRLKLFVIEVIKTLPKSVEFNLIDNMNRASRSATRNIAEGYGRFHYQENIQFCRVARGSIFEIWDDLITCFDDKYIAEEKYNEGIALIEYAIKVLNGYISYLEKAKLEGISKVKEEYEIYGYPTDSIT